MSARDDILRRVRHALRDVQTRDDGEPARERRKPQQPGDVVSLFVERVTDYKAIVTRCTTSNAAAAVALALSGTVNVLVPEGFPDELLPGGHRRVEDSGLSASALDDVDAVLTTASVGIAETGTIVLDHGPGQGRRAATLVPDRHVCIVSTNQVVADVSDAVALLDPMRPQTWVSGPSATSDIELERVEGVHGPRELYVIVVESESTRSVDN
jgi:L-lactate dehydrogenase complex protein LldG